MSRKIAYAIPLVALLLILTAAQQGRAVANPPGGSGGITRTPFEMTQGRSAPALAPYNDIAFILNIDYVAKTMRVSIRGSSGPTQNLSVLTSVDIGTAAIPRVVPGNWAIIERIQDQYFVTGYQVMPNSGNLLPAPAGTPLQPPQNFTAQVIGANLVFSWTPVPGAIGYQIFQNTSASPVGATLLNLGGITGNVGANTTVTVPLNLSSLGNVISVNPGFESGGFYGWIPDASPWWFISSATAHSGTYSALLNLSMALQTANLNTQWYSVSPGAPYNLSVWYNQTVAGNRNFLVITNFLFSNGSGGSVTLTDLASGSTGGWVNYSTTFTAPGGPGTLQMQVGFQGHIGVSGSILNYIDDLSVSGLGAPIVPTNFFAVQAYGSFGQSSPFSYWVQVVASPQSIGSPN